MLRDRWSNLSIVSVSVLALIMGACNGSSSPDLSSDREGSTSPAAGTEPLPQGAEPVDLDPEDFTTTIDNPYFPLEPGTRMTYREVDEEGAGLKVVVVVTTDTKMIANGVTARVVRDTVTQDGEIIEDTKDWYAQDSEGNVWYLGEDTAEFENGKLSSRHGSFEAGVDGAFAGIIMPAHPTPGVAYRQEYYEGEAEDNGEILSVDEMADVPYGHLDNLVLEKNTITIEPKVLEYKLYARGIGMILALGISGGGGREELVKIDRVPASAGLGPLGSPRP